MAYPPEPPPAWQLPPPAPAAPKKKIAFIGCGGLVGFFVVLGIIGAIVGPAKKTATASAAAQTTPLATSAVPPTAAPTTAAPATAAPTTAKPPVPAPSTSKPKKPAAIHLARGAQHGLTNCIISYKNAQDGDGTSTFTALVVNKSGAPYSPTGSNPYSILLQMNLTDTAGTAYPVSESLGNGSRTAADNPGGSDWFTVNQGEAQVSANSTQGLVVVTLDVPLAQMKSIEGNIMITSETDDNYLKQTECAVRPG